MYWCAFVSYLLSLAVGSVYASVDELDGVYMCSPFSNTIINGVEYSVTSLSRFYFNDFTVYVSESHRWDNLQLS